MKNCGMGTMFWGPIFWAVMFAFPTVAVAQRAVQQQQSRAKTAPRATDGKPDLSGVWVGGTGGADFGNTKEPPMKLTPWGQDKIIWNKEPASTNGFERSRVELDPVYHCYPPGMVRLGPPRKTVGSGGSSVEIIQTSEDVVIIYQYRNAVRYIYTDGREDPKSLELTWNGHSIGRWGGDTLVVDTVGLRDESWLDSAGHERSAQLHVVERFRRPDADHLEIERTLTDPVALVKPYTTHYVIRLNPEYDLNENMDGKQYDCAQFMVRKPSFGEGINGLLGIADHP